MLSKLKVAPRSESAAMVATGAAFFMIDTLAIAEARRSSALRRFPHSPKRAPFRRSVRQRTHGIRATRRASRLPILSTAAGAIALSFHAVAPKSRRS